jgi:hypothetical protein
MSQREKDLKKAIRRATKNIGIATRAHDFNEVENLRKLRGTFAKQLMEEFEQGYYIDEGKTKFLPLDELEEHYQDKDVRKAVGVASATNDLFQARDHVRRRIKHVTGLNAEDVKTQVLLELDEEMGKIEKIINDINEDKTFDFDEIDKKRKANDDLLDGFDMSTLE